MAEAVYRVLQFGQEATFGSAVQATVLYPCDVGSGEFTLNRAPNLPDEDWGRIQRNAAYRGTTGVRIATTSLASEFRFEDGFQILEMALGSATFGGTVSPYTATITADGTADTTRPRTIRVVDDTQPYVAAGVLCTKFDIGYADVAPGSNSPWTITADLQAASYEKGTATAGIAGTAVLETLEGIYTTLAEGPSGTAFSSLPALTGSLVSYKLSSTNEAPLRPYGGSTDTATAHGRLKRLITVTAMLKVTSTVTSDFWDIYNVSGSLPTERRWRVVCSGSSSKSLTIDHLVRLTDVHVEPQGRGGERLVAVTGELAYDSTLASDVKMVMAGLTFSSLP